MAYQLLLTELSEGILTITINRPDKLNALNRQVFEELDDVFQDVQRNNEISGAIITGSGAKAFVAGADIAEFSSLDVQSASELSANGHRVLNMIESSSKPVIAAVNGFALGGGCELAMACHFIIASDNAKFGQPEVNLGLIPGYGGTQRLPRYIGKGRALQLLLTADMINAAEALQYGLVNQVTSQEELLPKCRSILNKIKTKSPLVVNQVIACVNSYYNKDENGFARETDEFSKCIATNDFKEGVSAFMEKRTAVFKGQ